MNAGRIANIIATGITEADVAQELSDDLYMLRSDKLHETCERIAEQIIEDRRERKARKHGKRR